MSDDAELEQLAAQQLDIDGWLDITSLITEGTRGLASGELIKVESLTLQDAMTSVQVMDARLDMGMLSESDLAAIAQWDVERVLTLEDTLWIVERMFSCEMTWHHSASLLQTIYTCNYYTEDPLPAGIGQPERTSNAERDLVLYPILIATGLCCHRVWNEYIMENVFNEEDVLMASTSVVRFLEDQYSLAETMRLLDGAQAFLEKRQGRASDMLLAHVSMRRRWLAVLSCVFVQYLSDDPGALDRSMAELDALRAEHDAYGELYSEHINAGAGTVVEGVFDKKCMHKFPSLAPIKPKELLTLGEAHATLGRLIAGVGLVRTMLRIESVESLVYFFQGVSRRAELPYVRSLLISVFASDGYVQLAQPLSMFVRRAIREISGTGTAEDRTRGEEVERIDLFCQEAARMLVDWFRTLCQNGPRQRRIALKYVAGWDSLQGEAEQLDTWLYMQRHGGSADGASDPARNAFWFSSWAYHMKLLLMGAGLMTGVRLSVYLAYELSLVFCYAAQVFEAHAQHLARAVEMSGSESGSRAGADSGQQQNQQQRLWTRRAVSDEASRGQVGRWQSIAAVQQQLATALWLVSHACERLGVFRPPWEWRVRRATRLALDVCCAQEAEAAQRARFALRFRVFARLGSPTALTFDAWVATRRQLDECPLGDLFVHAARILTDAKAGLDKARRAFDGTGGEELVRVLYYAVLANSVALAKLLKSAAAGHRALAASGADACAYREALLSEALAGLDGDATRAKAKRDRKKRAARSELVARAHEWQADVDGLALNVTWTTAGERQHPDWPVFTFV
ncbi:N-alpha-acetyltransferase, non-catalitic subunit [Coemansia sp. 'formosensis']|nr:N-alpha-acetyltransferase, non-catalitic subunit [Coemansia sp. 'formosensis']